MFNTYMIEYLCIYIYIYIYTVRRRISWHLPNIVAQLAPGDYPNKKVTTNIVA